MMKPIPGHEDYLACDDGRIFSMKGLELRELKACVQTCGYNEVWLDGKPVLVGRAVLSAHVGPCPPGHECHHINGDRTDDRLENLEWRPRSENERYLEAVEKYD